MKIVGERQLESTEIHTFINIMLVLKDHSYYSKYPDIYIFITFISKGTTTTTTTIGMTLIPLIISIYLDTLYKNDLF